MIRLLEELTGQLQMVITEGKEIEIKHELNLKAKETIENNKEGIFK